MDNSNKKKNNYFKVKRLAIIAPPILLTLLFSIMLIWSWREWADILIDFGRELYIPWQISSGKVLYKDLAHMFGPLSQYVNALLFKLFGISYTTIIVANIIVLVCLISLLYFLLKWSCSRLVAFLTCCMVLSVFSFSQYDGVGIFNFLSPYCHEATHGTFLSLLMIYRMRCFTVSQGKRDLILIGLLFGLIFLTKVDILFSAVVVVGFFFIIDWINKKDIKGTIQSAGLFVVFSCVPVLIFLGYFISTMPFSQALRAVCGSWLGILNPDIARNKFYINVMGLDDPIGNLIKMIYHTIIVLIAVAEVLFLSHLIKKNKDKLIFVGICWVLLIVTISLVFFVNLYEIGRSLPLLTLASFIYLLYLYLRSQKSDMERAHTLFPILLLSVFSLCMLWKIVLFCKLFHYGFYLALPSVVLLVSMLVWFLPEWFDSKFSGGFFFRIVMVIIVIIFSIRFIHLSSKFYKLKNYSIGAGGDRIVTYDSQYDVRSWAIASAIEWIRTNLSKKETFVVLPEGVMINYLTKRVNPTPYTNFMMPEMMTYGEDTILDAFIGYSPDYFVITHKNTSEYGVGYFGQDPRYGKKIMDWINENYYPVCIFGGEPLRRKKAFGIKVMKRGKK